MSRPDDPVRVDVSFAWWLMPWVYCAALVAALHGRAVDPDRIHRMVKRAVRIKVRY